MEHFWYGFEKKAAGAGAAKTVVKAVRGGTKATAQNPGFLSSLKNLGSSAVSAVGKGMDAAGSQIARGASAVNKNLPASVQNYTTGFANRVRANPVKSAIGATGLAYGAGRMTSPAQLQGPQYNNYAI